MWLSGYILQHKASGWSRAIMVGFFLVPQFWYQSENFPRIRILSFCVIPVHFTPIFRVPGLDLLLFNAQIVNMQTYSHT